MERTNSQARTKATRRIAAAGAIALAFCFAACTDTDQYGATETNDTGLTARVKQKLSDENVPGDIQVSARAGLVTLSGTVPDQTAKEKAENVTTGVDGVDRVMNNLRTTMAGDAPEESNASDTERANTQEPPKGNQPAAQEAQPAP